MRTMLVAVTGAAGHLGGVVVRQLLEAGATVRALVHDARRAIDGLALETHEGDLREPGVVSSSPVSSHVLRPDRIIGQPP